MTAEILYHNIDVIRENIEGAGCDVEEIIVTLVTGEKVHITRDDIQDGHEDRFLSFCNWNITHEKAVCNELWYHTFIEGKMAFRTIAAELIVMIEVVYIDRTE